MLTRTVAAFALLLAASIAAGCKPDRSRPLPLSDAGADMAAEPGAEAGGARSPVASGGGEKAAPAGTADAGAGEKPAADPEEPKAEPGDEPASGGRADGKTAGADQGKGGDRPVKKPRNVKALPGSWSTRQVTDYMKKQVARGLGAECDHCHDTSDFAADDNEHKQAARAMMRMNAELNRLYFRGKQVVTCFTCHQGKPEPARKK